MLVFMQSVRYSCTVLINLDYLDSFSKNILMSNFMKIRGVGAELYRADRETDIHDLKT